MQTRKWQDQSGAEKYTTEIVLGAYRGELVMLDGKPQDEAVEPPERLPVNAPLDLEF